MKNFKQTVKNVILLGLMGVALTSCYKGKYKDQLRLNEELTQVNMGLETKITNLEDAVDAAYFRIEENAIIIEGLNGDNSELSAQNAELGDVIVVLNAEITALKAALEASNNNSADLNAQLTIKTDDLNAAIAQINDLSDLVDELNAEIDRLNAIIADLQAVNADYSGQIQILGRTIVQLDGQISVNTRDINNYITQVQTLTVSNTRLQNIINTLGAGSQTEILRLQGIITTQAATIAANTVTIDNLNTIILDLNGQLDASVADVVALRAQLAVALDNSNDDALIASLRATIAANDTMIATLQTRIGVAETTLSNERIANAAAVVVLNGTITQLQADLAVALDNSADIATIAQLRADLLAALDNSADIAIITQLQADLAAALDNSADEATIAQLRTDLTTALDNSADVAEIARIQALLDAALAQNVIDAAEIVRVDLLLSDANIEILRLQDALTAQIAETARVQGLLDTIYADVDIFLNGVLGNIQGVNNYGGNNFRRTGTVGASFIPDSIVFSEYKTQTINGVDYPIVEFYIQTVDVNNNGNYDAGIDANRIVRMTFDNKPGAALAFAGIDVNEILTAAYLDAANAEYGYYGL